MMENTLFNLRLWLHRVRQRYQKKPRYKELPIVPGLPPGIDMEVVEDVCARHLNCAVASVSHIHLSGWKSSGAYRLIIHPPGGSPNLLIFKMAHYGDAEIPALKGLPVNPGPPEYDIYRQVSGTLANYLPAVYRVEEIEPGKTYRYLLEDLRADYRLMRTEEKKVEFAAHLPALHRALAEWAAGGASGSAPDASRLIRYGQAFSEAIQSYTRRSLEQYYRQTGSGDLKAILNQWDAIARVHLLPEFFTAAPQPIHGDANFSNIHLHHADPTRFKVVDWEWAGFGAPSADLTALLKGTLAESQRKAFSSFYHAGGGAGGEKQEYRRFLWTNLERAILDAGFVTAQHMSAAHQARINLESAITRSLKSILFFYRQLS